MFKCCFRLASSLKDGLPSLSSRFSASGIAVLTALAVGALCTHCDQSVNEPAVNFEEMVYVPHLTIMPDTVLPEDTFQVRASVFLANGCQVFDSLKIRRNNKRITLTYRKKEFQDEDFECNPRKTFILEPSRFSFSKTGEYRFRFQDQDGNIAKTQSLTVSTDTPQQNFEWQLRLKNTDIPQAKLDQLKVSYKEKLGVTLPDAPGVDTVFMDSMARVNDTLYAFSRPTVLIDSVAIDSLTYSLVSGNDSMLREFSPTTTENTIRRGYTEVIRKGPAPQ